MMVGTRATTRRALTVLVAPPLLLAACASDRADSIEPGTTTLSDRLEFASVQQAREVLGHPDVWALQLSAFDRSARMRTLEPVTTQRFLEFASDAAAAWTADEQGYWSAVIDRLSDAVEGLNLEIPNMLLVKTTGEEEFNGAYTRELPSIILPQERIDIALGRHSEIARDESWDFFLLAHELFHSLSRSADNPGQRHALYTLLGFEPLEGFEHPAELEERRLSDPQAYYADYALTVQTPSAAADVVAVLQSTMPLEDVIRLPTDGKPAIFGVTETVLLPVDVETGRVLRDDSGALITYGFDDTNWVSQMQRNSSYIIHPEELLADNFALLMEWRSTDAMPEATPSGFPVNDVGLLEAIEDVLTAGPDD